MSKSSKKVISTKPNSIKPTASRSESVNISSNETVMIFNRENFKWVLIGIGLITLGMVLMMGGSMPSPDVWDESLIYSPIRITLAPMVILAGLAVEVYAIFK